MKHFGVYARIAEHGSVETENLTMHEPASREGVRGEFRMII